MRPPKVPQRGCQQSVLCWASLFIIQLLLLQCMADGTSVLQEEQEAEELAASVAAASSRDCKGAWSPGTCICYNGGRGKRTNTFVTTRPAVEGGAPCKFAANAKRTVACNSDCAPVEGLQKGTQRSGTDLGTGTSYDGGWYCPPGHFVNKNSTCTPCPLGSYMPDFNRARACTVCETGKVTLAKGSTMCAWCPLNTAAMGSKFSDHDSMADCTNNIPPACNSTVKISCTSRGGDVYVGGTSYSCLPGQNKTRTIGAGDSANIKCVASRKNIELVFSTTLLNCSVGAQIQVLPVTQNNVVCRGVVTLTARDHLLYQSCNNTYQDSKETDVDCGGPQCKGCEDGMKCSAASDCKSGVCGLDGMCSPGTCEDGVLNGLEVDVDCGGSCFGCIDGKKCTYAADCASSTCSDNVCVPNPLFPATCSNGKKDGTETDVDCGGLCNRCRIGTACFNNTDCETGNCLGRLCAPEGAMSFSEMPQDILQQMSLENRVASQQAIEAQQAANDVLVLYEEGVDFSGNDIGSIRTNSAQTCAQQCQLNSQCNTFFWRKSGECFMKTARGTDVRDAEGTSGMLARNTGRNVWATIEPGYDYLGNDVAVEPKASLADCVHACLWGSTGCNAFTYSGGYCYYKKGRGTGIRKFAGAITGMRISNYAGGVPGVAFTQDTGFDYAGYDIQGVQARDALQCAGECIKVPGCNVYSYSLNDQRCYLKKAAGKSTRAVATFVAGYVARPLTTAVAAEPSVAATFERGYDYTSPNPDLAAIPDRSLAQCAQACKDNSACYFFSSNQQNKMCYLKGKMNAIQKFGGDEWYTGSVVRGGVVWDLQLDYWGNDLGNAYLDPASDEFECVGACRTRSGCNAMSFNVRDKACNMKFARGKDITWTAPDFKAGMIVQDPGAIIEHNYDYNGNDVETIFTPNYQDCIINCQRDQRCFAFSWAGGTCWKKSARGTAVNKKDGAVSGLVVRSYESSSGGPGSPNGGTCKPLCGDRNICGVAGCSLSTYANTYIGNGNGGPRIQLQEGALFSFATGLTPAGMLQSAADVTEAYMCNRLPVYLPGEMTQAVLGTSSKRDLAEKACRQVAAALPKYGSSPYNQYYLAAGVSFGSRAICLATRPCPAGGNIYVIGGEGMKVTIAPLPGLPPGTSFSMELLAFGYYGDKQYVMKSRGKMLDITNEGYGNDFINYLRAHMYIASMAQLKLAAPEDAVAVTVTGYVDLGVDFDYDNNGFGGVDHAVMISGAADVGINVLKNKFKFTLKRYSADVMWKVNSRKELVSFKTQFGTRTNLAGLTQLLDEGDNKVMRTTLEYVSLLINAEVEVRFMLTVEGQRWIARLMGTFIVEAKGSFGSFLKFLNLPTKISSTVGVAMVGDGGSFNGITISYNVAISKRKSITAAAAPFNASITVAEVDDGVDVTMRICQGSKDELCPAGMRCIVNVCVAPRDLPTLSGCFTDRDCPAGLGCTAIENARSTDIQGFVGRCAAPGPNVNAGFGAITDDVKPWFGAGGEDFTPRRKEEVEELLSSTPTSAGARFVPSNYF